jgi:hypothetical protein
MRVPTGVVDDAAHGFLVARGSRAAFGAGVAQSGNHPLSIVPYRDGAAARCCHRTTKDVAPVVEQARASNGALVPHREADPLARRRVPQP